MERLMTALLELTLPMALVIAVLLAAGPLLGRRFTAKWRYWAWLLIAAAAARWHHPAAAGSYPAAAPGRVHLPGEPGGARPH